MTHISSVQSFSHIRLFATPWTHHTRHSCPSPTSQASSNSHPSSWWCHPTISSFVITFSSCLQSFSASRSFQRVSSSHQVAKISQYNGRLWDTKKDEICLLHKYSNGKFLVIDNVFFPSTHQIPEDRLYEEVNIYSPIYSELEEREETASPADS